MHTSKQTLDRGEARIAEIGRRLQVKGRLPRTIVTDRLKSYAGALMEVMPGVCHRQGGRLNNRAENSHRPTRKRERRMQRFKSMRHVQRFCSTFSSVCNQFRVGRHALSALNYRELMRRRFREWNEIAETRMFAAVC